jgi:hypothetical protein
VLKALGIFSKVHLQEAGMTIIKTALKILCGTALALFTSVVAAHHGWSWYGNEPFELTAEVVETHFGNPHDRLTLKDSDGNEWDVLLSPPGRSRRAGFTEANVNVGDIVTSYGHRRSEGNNFEMKTERIRVGDKLYNLYPNRS